VHLHSEIEHAVTVLTACDIVRTQKHGNLDVSWGIALAVPYPPTVFRSSDTVPRLTRFIFRLPHGIFRLPHSIFRLPHFIHRS